MSASLVGSEMCIRDRRIFAIGMLISSRQPRDQVRRFVRRFEAQAITHPAVSYTHLTLPTICSV
eukprot:8825374-Alexandrium_andersonii.AAC.1